MALTFDLSGHVAVVTGSTSGIGLGIARSLAQAGAKVALNSHLDREEDHKIAADLASETGVETSYVQADMSKGEDCVALIDKASERLGPVDILVNNAGIQYVAPVEDFPVSKWDAIIAINLSSAFHTIRAAVPAMKQKKWGRIINIASAHGLTASPYKSAYVSAKHGLLGLTKTIALELAQEGATCNAICPGYVLTPLVEGQIPDQMKAHNMSREDVIKNVMLERQPTKEFLTVEQMGAFTAFLASDYAAQITGAALSADGGWTAMSARGGGRPAMAEKVINLALQGGGAHGAFTWGVLDRLLEDGRLGFEGISGTSAGAMNAVALADGWYQDGADGAREKLETFWRAIARNGSFSVTEQQQEILDRFLSFWMWPLAGNGGAQAMAKLFPLAPWANPFTSQLTSPYDVNPLNINPLREVVERLVDFDRVAKCKDFKLFIAATRVHSGKIRLFRREDLSADAVLASACLPYAFQAVEIDGEPHWDGGYTGNPALYPFFTETTCEDIVLVQINPIERVQTPRSSQEILERISEITFNASLLREFRAIDFVNRLIDAGRLEGGDYRRNRVHRIDASDELAALGAGSKFNTSWAFFTRLRDVGRQAASTFLTDHYESIGKRGTLDLREAFS